MVESNSNERMFDSSVDAQVLHGKRGSSGTSRVCGKKRVIC